MAEQVGYLKIAVLVSHSESPVLCDSSGLLCANLLIYQESVKRIKAATQRWKSAVSSTMSNQTGELRVREKLPLQQQPGLALGRRACLRAPLSLHLLLGGAEVG
jgi:hypothetical protein